MSWWWRCDAETCRGSYYMTVYYLLKMWSNKVQIFYSYTLTSLNCGRQLFRFKFPPNPTRLSETEGMEMYVNSLCISRRWINSYGYMLQGYCEGWASRDKRESSCSTYDICPDSLKTSMNRMAGIQTTNYKFEDYTKYALLYYILQSSLQV